MVARDDRENPVPNLFVFNDTATTEIYTESIVGSVRCVSATVLLLSVQLLNYVKLEYVYSYNTFICHVQSLIHIFEPTRPY